MPETVFPDPENIEPVMFGGRLEVSLDQGIADDLDLLAAAEQKWHLENGECVAQCDETR